MSGRILILDDEASIARVLRPVLAANAWAVFTAETAVEGLRVARDEAVDLVLLDLGLPDADGKDLIPQLREAGDLAIIVLSARHQETEKVAALEPAPTTMSTSRSTSTSWSREFAPRSGAWARSVQGGAHRSRRPQDRPSRAQGDPDGEAMALSPKEFALLRTLGEHSGQVVTQRRLLLAGWGDPAADPQYLRTYVALLRQKLEEDASEPTLITTEPGVGYRLNV